MRKDNIEIQGLRPSPGMTLAWYIRTRAASGGFAIFRPAEVRLRTAWQRPAAVKFRSATG